MGKEEYKETFEDIVEIDETYVAGKQKNDIPVKYYICIVKLMT